MAGVITLLTDFGTRDHYVAAMKGAILSWCPTATLVDVCHRVAPQDVSAAAYLLSCCRRDFPVGTVHLAVVDPGVGGRRKALALSAGGMYFVGPDNGLFTHVIREDKDWKAREITNESLFRRPVSSTFHGRDIFAPTAASLVSGLPFEEVGPPVRCPVELDLPKPIIKKGEITGTIIHVDRFGNLISNLRKEHFEQAGIEIGRITSKAYTEDKTCLTELLDKSGEKPIFLFNSSGYFEIAVRNGSAAKKLGLSRGDSMTITSEISG